MIATFTCSGEKEVHLAVQDAKAAFKIWSQKSGLERGRILLEAARIIRVCSLSPLPEELAVLAPGCCLPGGVWVDFGTVLGYDLL